ncbi:GlxA family transcriptional regulator [Roseobacter sinensis]|uniref:Helix-turn-helix domain-containing protein n=1 Tax=Roseobacter sinensis TaxID=2931391 RepID=A0ABT3BJM4_9RHOB|nr:helix-turn-helix domain-containing protein [Roseobacter sp. WL0113]MCV3273755.1 helix-turn-helix domain-containing protein [Roseobacter sp. WL0113]
MESFSAKPSDQTRDDSQTPHQIVFVVYPEIALLDLAGPLQVFAWARCKNTGALAYQPSIVSRGGGQIPTDTLLTVETEDIDLWADKHIDTVMVIGGDGVYEAATDATFVAKIAALAARADRVASVCSGAFLLASAGVLKGRRAATHWEDADRLRAAFPETCVDIEPIYIKHGHIWTSAGVTAGTDMALAIVAEDLGPEVALDRAKALVTYMVRPGGQSQFSPALERQRLDRSNRFDRLHGWIGDNLTRDLRVEDLAERENMSLRSFYRLYRDKMGVTPARAVEKMRTEAARDMLESTRLSMKKIAVRCGFKDEARMRRAFSRTLGVSPSAYRRRFQIVA